MFPSTLQARSPRRHDARRRDGMALLMALGAIVVIGGLVAGAFFVSTRDVRSGRSTISQEQAQLGVEDALAQARQIYASAAPPLVSDGATMAVPGIAGGGTVNVTRLNADAFMLTARATSGSATMAGDRARRRASLLLVRNVPQMNFPAALTVNGDITIGGSSEIKGTDANPSGWSCPVAGPTKPGLILPEGKTPTYSGAACKDAGCITGDPKVDPDPMASNPDTYFKYGTQTWDDLVARANIKLPAGTYKAEPTIAGGVCNTADQQNWGDPARPATVCANYFPIIHIRGNATINGVRGQGVLLVEGDLSVQGGFEFYGPVIAKGILKTAGTGGHFNGGVMAANVELDASKVIGNALVQFSSCAIATALRMSSPPMPVSRRAWADLY